MKSLYRDLVVSGCSFTFEPGEEDTYPFAWPSVLAQDTDMNVVNLALGGAGNAHISRSTIIHLEKHQPDPGTTLVMIMWSGVGRFDWITDRELSQFGKKHPVSYSYDDHNELVLSGNWWNTHPDTDLNRAMIAYAKYQSDYSFALTSWLAMTNLSNYLDVHGYRYLYTSFVDYKRNNVKGDGMIVPYPETLEKLGLKLDRTHWIDIPGPDHYGDWALANDAVSDDGFHPRHPKATLGWTRQVLIPYLITQGIVQS
jgi:hypothetical protein